MSCVWVTCPPTDAQSRVTNNFCGLIGLQRALYSDEDILTQDFKESGHRSESPFSPEFHPLTPLRLCIYSTFSTHLPPFPKKPAFPGVGGSSSIVCLFRCLSIFQRRAVCVFLGCEIDFPFPLAAVLSPYTLPSPQRLSPLPLPTPL
jgi:hypothetical protein